MIRVDNLARRYGELIAVNDVSFEIEQGEVVGLLGPNGAGKTTIMKMLTGFLEPTSGTVRLNDLIMGRDTAAIQRRVGYLPENCPLWPEMTVIDYLAYIADIHEIGGDQRDRAVLRAIRRTDLEDKAVAPIHTLSRGYQQRVGVAQALLHDPDILILDEPTNGLDPTQIHQMRDLIRELSRSATVIISTHVLQEVQAVCERVLIMRSGELAIDQNLGELTSARSLDVTLSGDGDPASIFESFDDIGQYRIQTRENGQHCYRLEANPELAPAIASSLIGAGFDLYALEPRRRDLETLFAEVIEEVSHA